ncbi:MAG: rod-binding protein [Rhodobacteraceae bacterium]|nr:rod-binding protein [Paracoccaceae bacterium]
MITPIPTALLPQTPKTPLKEAAQAFEAAFLAQMLAAAGAGKPAESLGGIGESQVASFLLDAQAHQIAERGGIGIAETIIRHFANKI